MRESFVDAEHFLCLDFRFPARGMRGVPLLPEEFGGAEEKARAHFPPYDVRPLVDQNGEVAVGLNPARIHFADNCFGSRADDERLFERRGGNELPVGPRFEARVGYNRAFLGKALDVFRLFFEVAYGNEEREIRVCVPRVFEHFVEAVLHVFPKRVPPRFDDHAAANGAVFSQVRRLDYLLIPFGIVLSASRLNRRSFFFCHSKINKYGAILPPFRRDFKF